MAISRGPRIVTNGLALLVDAADRNSYPGSGALWADLSGNRNNGTLVNGPTFNGTNGGGIVFDGTDDRGTFPTPITASSSQTYEIWTNAMSSGTADTGIGYLLHNNNVSNTIAASYLTIGITTSQQYFAVLNGNYAAMTSSVTASNSRVVQIILTWDGSTQKMYVNGDFKVSGALAVTPQNFSTTTSFGDYSSSAFRMIVGNVYSIKIYNRALTESEILQNFNAMRKRFGV